MVKRKSSKRKASKKASKKAVKKPAYLKTKSMILKYLNQTEEEE